jgi:acyl dehydratase
VEYPFKENENFTAEFTVSQEIYDGFIKLFGDRNPMHTDPAFAAGKGFKGIIMHGNILNGFLSYFIGEILPVKNVIIHSQEINYRKPVYLNDRLTLKARVSEVHESVNVVIFKFSFITGTGETAAKGTVQTGILV